MFRSTAEGETGHAHGHLEYLEETGDPATGLPIGGTADNLRAAIAGETHEYTDMYPGMAKTARDEGLSEVADWMETLAKAERSHANRRHRREHRHKRLDVDDLASGGQNVRHSQIRVCDYRAILCWGWGNSLSHTTRS